MKKTYAILVVLFTVSCGTGTWRNTQNSAADFASDARECRAAAAALHAQDDPSRVAGGVSGISTEIKIDYEKCLKERGYTPPRRHDSVADRTDSTLPPVAPTPSPADRHSTGKAATSVVIESQPPDGEVYVDGSFVGSAPVKLRLAAGSHTIEVKRAGFTSWTRELKVSDAPVRVVAVLQPE